MNGLSGISAPPQTFDYPLYSRFGCHAVEDLYNTAPWPEGLDLSDDQPRSKRKTTKRSKKTKIHRPKPHKQHRKHRIGAYILQVIGLICLVLAAVKSFEPLTGVGFTLILIGHDKRLRKTSVTDLFNGKKKHREAKDRNTGREKKKKKKGERRRMIIEPPDRDREDASDHGSN